ncbi:MAG: hypothetical protein M3Y87_04350 [Myxococcota bacterium]|nr:hypothetical protein [Myxococcota bacterium]
MEIRVLTLGIALASGCGGAVSTPEPASIAITLAHDRPAERRTRAQLERILAAHDLSRWIRTSAVQIDEEAIPHSHPVLTLHARHLGDDDLLLATFVHEQMHWLLEERAAAAAAAVVDLRAMFPEVPVGFPDGARSAQSSYEHLIVDHLEHDALRRVRGPEVARRVLEHWTTDHYRVLYRMELDHEAEIARILARHGLVVE